MPVSMIYKRLISVIASCLMTLGNGHYDLSKFNNQTSVAEIVNTADTELNKAELQVQATTISVSCIRLKWNGASEMDYKVTAIQLVPDDYIDNIYFEFKSDTLCYVTGLRENTEYQFNICDSADNILATTTAKTETVEVIQEYEYQDGWTCCFAYENANGLTLNPSYSAIQGCSVDKVTNTGIMRDEYGDYCCAMGTFYGYCGDRFLITLENGTQFTTKICDSKGDRIFHPFGIDGKCIIEFIHADGYLPECVSQTGNYGSYNWSGLSFDNIQSIKKINYGEPVEY